MSVFGVLRGFTFLARDVFEAALYLIPAPGLSGYDVDEPAPWWAEELAEREAAVDVTEPMDCGLVGEFAFGTNQYMPLPYLQNPDPCGSDCECPPDCHGSWDDWDDPIADCHIPNPDDCCLGGDFPPAADDAPTPPDHPSYPKTNEPNHLTYSSASPSISCPNCGSVFAVDVHFYGTAHNAPVASASPPTPADATGQQETLGNDPHSVHQRHMRRLLGEDQGRP